MNCPPEDVVSALVGRAGAVAAVPPEVVEARENQQAARLERDTVLASLHCGSSGNYETGDPRLAHGRLFSTVCLAAPRSGEAGWLEDSAPVITRKLTALRDLLRLSRRTVLYTEADQHHDTAAHYGSKQCGISHSSRADPATALAGRLHCFWVQLGHTSRPAGADSAPVTEIYDSWRGMAEYQAELLRADTELGSADLVLAVGDTLALAGPTAQLVRGVAEREYQQLGRCLGLVILSENKTDMDRFATIKINLSPELAIQKLMEMMENDKENNENEYVLDLKESIEDTASSAETETTSNVCGGENTEGEKPAAAAATDAMEGPPCDAALHRASIVDRLAQYQQLQQQDLRRHHGRLLADTCLEAPVRQCSNHHNIQLNI